MEGKQWTIVISLIAYVVIIGLLTFYHAFHFSDYVHTKGDETVNYTLFLFLSSLLFQGFIWFIEKTIAWKFVLLSTIVNFIVSFILGLGMLMWSGLYGIPKHLIFIYGGCYITCFILVVLLQMNKINKTKT